MALKPWVSAKVCCAEQRAPPTFGGWPSHWALAHISSSFFSFNDLLEQRDLGNYNTDLQEIFSCGRHVGVDVHSGIGYRIGQGTLPWHVKQNDL